MWNGLVFHAKSLGLVVWSVLHGLWDRGLTVELSKWVEIYKSIWFITGLDYVKFFLQISIRVDF